MAKIKQKKLVVDLAPGVDFWDWYQRDAAPDVADWIGGIDGGDTADRFATTEEPEVNIPQVEGTFDFAVVQKDTAGNESDPATFPGWTAVPLDLSPPAPATGGAIIDA
jgi:hypothetical protein